MVLSFAFAVPTGHSVSPRPFSRRDSVTQELAAIDLPHRNHTLGSLGSPLLFSLLFDTLFPFSLGFGDTLPYPSQSTLLLPLLGLLL